MGLLSTCKTFLFYLGALIGSPVQHDQLGLQQPLQGIEFASKARSYPKFPAPHGPFDGEPFKCEYPSLKDWTDCSTPDNRGCWLRGPGGKEFNITTDYEFYAPKGIQRNYTLTVSNQTINADGIPNHDGKVFNNMYPGPWIQACWGDTISVTVINTLPYNGTAIHWHGIRQNGTLEMDGVNGVTQCPIAPGDNFTYTFEATQYGTSWYHSHYSLQYADGLAGPLTIYGPSSARWDEARDPILVTDWNHRSAFKDFYKEANGVPPTMNGVLINGLGNYAGATTEGVRTQYHFQEGKRYLLRIINTSVTTTFIFSIDNHDFEVLTTDFVPIHPYNVSHIAIGIGQRYHVVVNAVPTDRNRTEPLDANGNYWIRAIPADGCKGFDVGNDPDERQGIVRYDEESTALATTFRSNKFNLNCRDEHYGDMRPIVEWEVPENKLSGGNEFDVGLQTVADKPLPGDSFIRWGIGDDPMWLNFSDPTILDIPSDTWPKDHVVVPEDYDADRWIYLVITATPRPNNPNDRRTIPAAHPIHLHGHDFAILEQRNTTYNSSTVNLKFDNPPRRDVVLLPAGGYVVIAFKADNPGAWLLHCHIAWHASNGLALQILERQGGIDVSEGRLAETRRVCANWNTWFADAGNLWNGTHEGFQDDSGI